MNAGRDLDAKIAIDVMGESEILWEDECPIVKDPDGMPVMSVPNYSTEIKDAWEVVDQLKERDLYMSISDMRHECYRQLGVGFKGFWVHVSEIVDDGQGGRIPSEINSPGIGATTAPHAICLAALEAIKIKENNNE